MIAVSPERAFVKRLAFSRDGLNAYYIEPSEARLCGLEGEKEGYTSSPLVQWQPDVLGNGRVTMFIAGNPGAGKTYFAKEIINMFPPNRDVLLFTALQQSDGNFAGMKRLYKIKMTPENLKMLTLENIRSMSEIPVLLFDDVDKIRDPEIKKLMFALMDDALANGRGHEAHDGRGDIHVIITSHALNDYFRTKYAFENTDFVVVFPQATTKSQFERLLVNKIGIDKKKCAELLEDGKKGLFRSVVIRKVAPMYIISGSLIELI